MSSPSLVPRPPTMSPLGRILEHAIPARRPPEDLKIHTSLPLLRQPEGSGVAVHRRITIGWDHTYPGTQASQHPPPRESREIRGTTDYYLLALIQSPREGPAREGAGESCHRGGGVYSSYILLFHFLISQTCIHFTSDILRCIDYILMRFFFF